MEAKCRDFCEKKCAECLQVYGKSLPLQPQTKNAEIAQLVEHNLAKVRVASSSLVFRSCFFEMLELNFAQVAELVDAHVSGACVERHAGSSPVLGTEIILLEFWRGGGIGRRATLRG